eukprot:CAMPEP_0198735682 /NCGR_PEP_ID=MMETSP1475-20131203/61174_1 /TAXON_ID= ORGANISM="Unidentified sp., Strain CCMP1999" /NCGR_SAMPLE_ID=MMETSP1475 /ASSEMBLY_ACC=CAM_ASM_001111 /LENGTH=261 /DNA_ID=CAMNT_0044499379 /DNA_START=199 /DNA_END=984 /DNA_ORIENTATION=-
MNFGGGFLGVGPAEIIVVVVVGWFVLGPKELLRVAREVGLFLGSLRQQADTAKQTLTDALEMENLTEDYRKTVDAFKSGYEGRPMPGEEEKLDEEKESTKIAAEKAGGEKESTKIAAEQSNGTAKNGEEKDELSKQFADSKKVLAEETKREAEELDEAAQAQTEEFAREIAAADEETNLAAQRFRDQLNRVNDDAQVPPTVVGNGKVEDLSVDADDVRAVELEYLDERAKLELQQLERKYDEMKKKILDRKKAQIDNLQQK